MLLATRCPFCETVCQIQPAFLPTHRDQIRCEHCHASFSIAGNLFELPEDGNLRNARPVLSGRLTRLMNGVPDENETTQTQARPQPQSRTATVKPVRPRADFSNRGWNPWAPLAESRVAAVLLPDVRRLPCTTLLSGIPVIPRNHTFHGATVFPVPATPPEKVTPPAPAISTDSPSPPKKQAESREPQPIAPSASKLAVNDDTVVSPYEKNEWIDAIMHEERQVPVPHKQRNGSFWHTLTSAFVTLIVFVLICVILIWNLRDIVMTRWPASQPLYQAACMRLGCDALPVHDITGLGMMQASLHQMNDVHHLELTVPIRNSLNVALAWPAIHLTLLDAKNRVITQRVLHPKDYVTPVTAIHAGLAAYSTQTMTVQIDAGNVVASNFRLEIFYP